MIIVWSACITAGWAGKIQGCLTGMDSAFDSHRSCEKMAFSDTYVDSSKVKTHYKNNDIHKREF